ncbi:MAG: hypothetical protein KDK76_05935 [Chlamydiia bacterium]|nr:hypothetical protein [Chlamydiia bacterium]
MMKKLAVLLLVCLSIVYGEEKSSAETPPNRSAHPCRGYTGLFVTGDFIYWKSRQEELNTIGNLSLVQDVSSRNIEIKSREIDFEFSPGFKLGLGNTLPYDGWDLYANWTHFHNHPKTTFHSQNHDLINFERLGEAGIIVVSDRAEVDYDLMFNTLDFDWGRRFYVSNSLSLRLSFGGKVAWIDQTIIYRFENSQTILIPNIGAIQTPNEFSKSDIDFWGIGPYFAANGKWHFKWGLGIFGEVSGALLWGHFDQKTVSESPEVSVDEGNLNIVVSRVKNTGEGSRVRPALQMFVGLDWEWCFIPNRLSTQFRVGYETQYFWEQILNLKTIETSNLSLEGITIMGRIDF